MKRLSLILILSLGLCGCGLRYSEEEVNATVSAKIREMASNQKVYVTQETIIVKEYIVVTPTIDMAAAVVAEQQATQEAAPTALPYDHMNGEQIAQTLAKSGIKIRRFFYNLSAEETNNLSLHSESATKFTLSIDGTEYEGRFFQYTNPEDFEKGLASLKESPSSSAFLGNQIIPYENMIIEFNGLTPEDIVQMVSDALSADE